MAGRASGASVILDDGSTVPLDVNVTVPGPSHVIFYVEQFQVSVDGAVAGRCC